MNGISLVKCIVIPKKEIQNQCVGLNISFASSNKNKKKILPSPDDREVKTGGVKFVLRRPWLMINGQFMQRLRGETEHTCVLVAATTRWLVCTVLCVVKAGAADRRRRKSREGKGWGGGIINGEPLQQFKLNGAPMWPWTGLFKLNSAPRWPRTGWFKLNSAPTWPWAELQPRCLMKKHREWSGKASFFLFCLYPLAVSINID